MKNLLIILLLWAVGHDTSAQKPKGSVKQTKMLMATWIDSRIVNFLGKESLSAILQADSVRSYILNPEDTLKHPQKLLFEGIAIHKTGPKLSHWQMRILNGVITEPKGYNFSGVVQFCAFTPTVGLECFMGSKSVKILICLTCDEWLFVSSSKPRKSYFGKSRKTVLSLITQLFPKENFTQ